MVITVIVDYEAGNLRSVQRACKEVGVDAEITADPNLIKQADRIIFPGVGIAKAAMTSIRRSGVDQALLDVYKQGTPILGICIGLQISLDRSEEGDIQTLGLIEGEVKRFQLNEKALKVPHMGWNEVNVVQEHPILNDIELGDAFYFVHSYYPNPRHSATVYATSDYESTFACALGQRNFFGTQFHPEKSGRVGLQLIKNFIDWDGQVAE